MKNFLLLVFFGITMLSCSKEEDNYFTIEGTITVVNDLESTGKALEGVQILIAETECIGECFLCTPTCKFIQNLEDKDISDGDGRYSITFRQGGGLSYNAKIVIPEGYKLIYSGGTQEVTVNSTFEHDFILSPLE